MSESVGAEIITCDPKAHTFLQRWLFLGACVRSLGEIFFLMYILVSTLPKMLDFLSVAVGSTIFKNYISKMFPSAPDVSVFL